METDTYFARSPAMGDTECKDKVEESTNKIPVECTNHGDEENQTFPAGCVLTQQENVESMLPTYKRFFSQYSSEVKSDIEEDWQEECELAVPMEAAASPDRNTQDITRLQCSK